MQPYDMMIIVIVDCLFLFFFQLAEIENGFFETYQRLLKFKADLCVSGFFF